MANDGDAVVVPAGGLAAVLADELKELHGSEITRILRPGRESHEALIAILPEGKRIENLKEILDAYLQKPERRKGTAKFFDVRSFIEHTNRFASSASAVFANPSDRTKPSFTSVLDYHPEDSEATETDWLQHRGVYEPALSEEWKVWSAKNSAAMMQGDFAAFVEDRISDVVVPDESDERIREFAKLVGGRFAFPSDLLQLSRGLQVNIETTVRNAVTLDTGEISVTYDEQHRDGAGQPIKIANLFQIVIPVFYAGVAYRIAVRLRYRNVGGKIQWHYQLVRPDLVFDAAFEEIREKVENDTERTVFLGAPEA